MADRYLTYLDSFMAEVHVVIFVLLKADMLPIAEFFDVFTVQIC
jgi:hypothetical protein